MSEFTHSEDVRKNRILDAALIEFSDKGYRKGSTNTIVKEANVSKGLLFHYFESKKGLFIDLYEYCMREVTKEMFANVNLKDRDVLHRCKASTISKIESIHNHPLFAKFFEQLNNVEDEEIIRKSKALAKKISFETFDSLFVDIDYFVFKDSLNIDRALKVIGWTLDRVAIEWQENNVTIHDGALLELQEEIDNYIDLLKEALYK